MPFLSVSQKKIDKSKDLLLLIDGTVEGNPADMTVAPYKDGTVVNDHTYYGRGCNNSWGTSGEGGSQTPCPDINAGGRYVKTADNETQKNGTYYNFQAGTSGAGAAITTDNTNSSDTFCPLGWQLPYSGTGGDYYNKSRSWNKLFTEYNIAFGDGTATDATKIKSYPFSYVYSGYYGWNTGRLYYQSNGGVYWSSTVVSSTNAYYLRTWSSGVSPANSFSKAHGHAVRCVHHSIDGTVEGIPADLTIYIDTDSVHDHAFFGNGCPSNSITPCSTRIVKTADNENQKNGTYYTFQAVTDGTGGALSTNNTNSQDTFCPLGWQLPYSGTGGDYYDKSKSWNHLFTTYSIGFNDGITTDSTKIGSYPFSYVQSGVFNWGTGRLYYLNDHGNYWSSTIVYNAGAYDLDMWPSGIRTASTNGKTNGFVFRCVKFLASFSRFA